MLVVSDATPLNILIRLGHVEVLPALFERVAVPSSVVEEMSRSATPAVVRAWTANPPDWISIHVRDTADSPTSLRHQGERDAIALAQQIAADAILLDDEKPRAQAKRLGLRVVGTVGILEVAADRGLLEDLAGVHVRLRATDFRIADAVLANSLARHLQSKG